jgi:E3 ubiquitin-protein ligase UBR1
VDAIMSGFSSFLGRVIRERERTTSADPTHALRYALETLPTARANVYTPGARATLLAELYHALWAGRPDLFLPGVVAATPFAPAPAVAVLPAGALLAETQTRLKFYGAGAPEPAMAGRPCGHIFAKGESCFRCK